MTATTETTERRTFGTIYRQKRSPFLWVRYRMDGVEHRESCGSTSERVAEALLTRRQTELGLGAFVAPTTKRTTFEDLAQIIRNDYRVNKRKSEYTLETLLNRLTKTFAHARASAITPDRIVAYVRQRFDQGAAGSTIRNETNALKRAFRLAKRLKKVQEVPDFPTVRVADPRQGFFERPQFNAVLAQLVPSLQGPVEFAYCTGWRRSEILSLTWAQVDFTVGMVRLEVGDTKNSDGRTFPFDVLPDLADLMIRQRAYVDQLERQLGRIIPDVFVRETGKPIKDFYTAWHSACQRAAVKRRGNVEVVVHPDLAGRLLHDFRRTAVRNLERAGVPRSIAKKLTGHKTDSVYNRYAIVNEADLSEGVEKLARLYGRDKKAQSGMRGA